MATVDIQLDLSDQNKIRSPVRLLILPFQLDQNYQITKPDDIEATVIISRGKYTLLNIIVANSASNPKITISNAFNLIDDRLKNRVKFQFYMSYSNFQQYADLLKDDITISKFDILIKLPNDYREDELSFKPAKDKWTQISTSSYSINKDAVSGKEVFLAFPSPFGDARNTAQIVIGAIAGFFTFLVGSNFIFRRRVGILILILILILSSIGLSLTYYYYTSLADPLSFLAWVIGLALPWTFAPFLCLWYLIRLWFDAEIGGEIYTGEQAAQFVSAEIYAIDGGQRKLLKRKAVDENGRYKAYVWCGFKQKLIIVRVDAEGYPAEESAQYQIRSRSKILIDRITITRTPLAGRAESAGTSTAGQPALGGG